MDQPNIPPNPQDPKSPNIEPQVFQPQSSQTTTPITDDFDGPEPTIAQIEQKIETSPTTVPKEATTPSESLVHPTITPTPNKTSASTFSPSVPLTPQSAQPAPSLFSDTASTAPTSKSASPDNPLSAFELFKPSIEVLKLNALPLSVQIFGPVLFMLVTGLFTGYLSVLSQASNLFQNGGSLSAGLILYLLVNILLSAFFSAGVPWVLLKGARGEQVSINEALNQGKSHLVQFIGIAVVSFILIFSGLLLLIVPGIFLAQRLLLSMYFMYDKNTGIIESMRQSSVTAKQHSGAIWGVLAIQIVLSLVSGIPIIGIAAALVSLLYLAAPALRYTQLDGTSNKGPLATKPATSAV